MQIFVLAELADGGKQIKEIGKQLDVLPSHIGDEENGDDIFGRSYPLK